MKVDPETTHLKGVDKVINAVGCNLSFDWLSCHWYHELNTFLTNQLGVHACRENDDFMSLFKTRWEQNLKNKHERKFSLKDGVCHSTLVLISR